jgi:hypothetical protein
MLTNEEKIGIITQHLKNAYTNQYNLEVSLIEANAKSTPDQSSIDLINLQLTDIAAQKTALEAELASLQA